MGVTVVSPMFCPGDRSRRVSSTRPRCPFLVGQRGDPTTEFSILLSQNTWTKDLNKRTVFVGRDSVLWVFSTFQSVICHILSLFPDVFRDVCNESRVWEQFAMTLTRVNISSRNTCHFQYRMWHESLVSDCARYRVEVPCRVPQPQATPSSSAWGFSG